ncbi:MAG: hypothetical protein R2867_12080 [Caldilineaceae bacterium]
MTILAAHPDLGKRSSSDPWGSDAAAGTAHLYRRHRRLEPVWCLSGGRRAVTETLCARSTTAGQLLQRQRPQQAWRTVVDGCGSGSNSDEVDVNYLYDALGRQTKVSVPEITLSHDIAWQSAHSDPSTASPIRQ